MKHQPTSVDICDSLLKKTTPGHLTGADFADLGSVIKQQQQPQDIPSPADPEVVPGSGLVLGGIAGAKDMNDIAGLVRSESSLPSVSSSFINIWNPNLAGSMPNSGVSGGVSGGYSSDASVAAVGLGRASGIPSYNQTAQNFGYPSAAGYYSFDTSYAPYFNNSYPTSAAALSAVSRYPYSVGGGGAQQLDNNSTSGPAAAALFNPISTSTVNTTVAVGSDLKQDVIRNPLNDLTPVWKGY